MIIRKPYDMSSSEASRIRNLHESANKLITEGTPCSTWLSIMGPGNSGDVDCCQVLADGPSGANWHMVQPTRLCDKQWIAQGQTSQGWQNCCPSVVIPTNPTNPISAAKMKPKTDNRRSKKVDTVIINSPMPKGPGDIKPGSEGYGPQSEGVSRNADLEEIRYMNELYDITLGHEDIPNPLEGRVMVETTYELPKRFGNKRLTESQLIDMVNSIVKKY